MSDKTDKYEYLTGEYVLPFDQSRMIEQATFTCSSAGKTFGKHIKIIEDEEQKNSKRGKKSGLN